MGTVGLLHLFDLAEGAYPVGSLTVGGDGAVYGVAEHGGPAGAGTVYRVDPAGTFTTVHSFNWTDGGGPDQGLLLAKDGALYGVTPSGLPARAFRIDSAGTVSYPVFPNQHWPVSPLIQGSDCGLYGAAFYYDSTIADTNVVVYRIFEPGHLCQRIEFDPLPDRVVGDLPFTVTATASSGLSASFSASGSCTVSGDQVTLTGVGVCTLTASQVGDARYEPAAEVSQAFAVLEAPDADSDGVADAGDDCVEVANSSQLDSNQDGYGDACDADFNDDGIVGGPDWLMLARAWGATVGSPAYAPALDTDGDGSIGAAEFLRLAASFGRAPGPSALGCAGTSPCSAP